MNIEELNTKANFLLDEAWKNKSKRRQNFDKAKKLLELALKMNSDDEITLINHGTLLCDMGSHRMAAEYLRKAIEQGSLNQDAFYNLGVALVNSSSHEAGMDYMEESRFKVSTTLTREAYFDPIGR